jgi:hypothetical protein
LGLGERTLALLLEAATQGVFLWVNGLDWQRMTHMKWERMGIGREVGTWLVLLGALACGEDNASEGSSSLALDKDHDGTCDEDVDSFLNSCATSERVKGKCPVPKLSDTECAEICANAVALGTDRNSACFAKPDEAVWLTDMKFCQNNCTTDWSPCSATYRYCFKGAKTCAEVESCRIEKLR